MINEGGRENYWKKGERELPWEVKAGSTWETPVRRGEGEAG